MKLFKVYQVEVGVLLYKEHPEYSVYSEAWDHKNAYYDEEFTFFKKLEDAKDYIENYIISGVINTYGILSEVYVDEEAYECIEDNVEEQIWDMDYNVENVIYSAYKDEKNNIIENFVDNEKHIENEESEVL